MKSDTPRTDLNCLTVDALRTMRGTGTKIVLAAVCRQLERELNEAKLKIQKMDEELKQLRSRDEFWKKYTITTV